MIVSGINIAEADGLHDDGWCWPTTKLRLTATTGGAELRIGVWMKPEQAAQDRTVFTLTSDKSSAKVQVIPFNTPVEISVPVTMSEGEELNLTISTPHRASKGDDARDLSFVLLSLVLL